MMAGPTEKRRQLDDEMSRFEAEILGPPLLGHPRLGHSSPTPPSPPSLAMRPVIGSNTFQQVQQQLCQTTDVPTLQPPPEPPNILLSKARSLGEGPVGRSGGPSLREGPNGREASPLHEREVREGPPLRGPEQPRQQNHSQNSFKEPPPNERHGNFRSLAPPPPPPSFFGRSLPQRPPNFPPRALGPPPGFIPPQVRGGPMMGPGPNMGSSRPPGNFIPPPPPGLLHHGPKMFSNNPTISKPPTIISSAPKLYTKEASIEPTSKPQQEPPSLAPFEPKKKKQKVEPKPSEAASLSNLSHALEMAEKVKQTTSTVKTKVTNPAPSGPPSNNHPPHGYVHGHHGHGQGHGQGQGHMHGQGHGHGQSLGHGQGHGHVHGHEEKKKDRKPKKYLRYAGGQVWEDTSLTEWDPDDFRLFAGDLGNDVTDELLNRYFNHFASFVKAKVVRDKRTNKSKGYGFVSFRDPQDYIRAMKEMDGKYVGSRPIKLRKSTWKDRSLDVVQRKQKEKHMQGLK